MLKNSLQEAIDTVNGFESKLTQPNITNYKTYFTSVSLSNIPETADITEFLHKMLEKSQQFTSSYIKSKLFTLTDTHIELKVEFQLTYTMLELPNKVFFMPDQWNFDELLGIVEKD